MKAAAPFSIRLQGWSLTRNSVMVAMVPPRMQQRAILTSQRNIASRINRLRKGLFTNTVCRLKSFVNSVAMCLHIDELQKKQDGAELCQTQVKLERIVKVGVQLCNYPYESKDYS